MAESVIQPQKPDSIHTFFFRFTGGHASHHQRHDYILKNIIGGYQLIILEDKPDLFISYVIEFALFHFMNRIAVQEIFAGIRDIHTADDIHQRCFP